MHTNATSPIYALLALPEIGFQGIERSVIFPLLPAAAQTAIRRATSEADKRQLAAQAGDALPVILEMYEDCVIEPQQRRSAGLAFPTFADLGNFFLPGVLHTHDRSWLRVGQQITAIEVTQESSLAQGWQVLVRYADGEQRLAAGSGGESCFFSCADAMELAQHIRTAAFILGNLID